MYPAEGADLKTPITVRIESHLLAVVRDHARRENRTLTNFIETVLLTRVEAGSMSVRREAQNTGNQSLIAPDAR